MHQNQNIIRILFFCLLAIALPCAASAQSKLASSTLNAPIKQSLEVTGATHLQLFLAGKAFGESETRLPRSSRKDTATSGTVTPLTATQLQNEINSFVKRFDALIGTEISNLVQITRYFQQLPEMSGLKADYRRLKAHHQLHLASLESLDEKLRRSLAQAQYFDRLAQSKARYTGATQGLFQQFDAVFETLDRPESGLSGFVQSTLLKLDFDDLRKEINQWNKISSKQDIKILRYSNLPYQALALPAKPVVLTPNILPSYANPNPPDVEVHDTATKEISGAVLSLAAELEHDPIRLYQFVNSKIDTQWYYGSLQGAVSTLRNRSGNSTDQANLLVELFRASGIPARYVFGVIELSAQRLINMLGTSSINQAVNAVRRAGIPLETITSGGQISAVHIQHTWVSAHVPYANYRGATVDASGVAWLPLMPALKNYEIEHRASLLQQINFDEASFRQEVLSTPSILSPVETLKKQVEQFLSDNGSTENLQSMLSENRLSVADAGYLPNSLPVDVVAVTREDNAIPVELHHTIRLYARRGIALESEIAFDLEVPVAELLDKDVTLSYQPGSLEDHNLALSFGGMNNVPLFLLSLRPQIKVQGKPIKVADKVIAAGQAHRFTIELNGPSGQYSIDKVVTAGGYHAIGIGAPVHKTLAEALGDTSYETAAGRILNQIAKRYQKSWDASENELAQLANRVTIHPLPSIVFASNDVRVTSLLGEPQSLVWQGVNLDAAFRITDSQARSSSAISEQSFISLSALQGSFLEHHIFEALFSVSSISAEKGLGLATQSGIQILELTSANLSSIETKLTAHPQAVQEDVTNWLQLGYAVEIPTTPIQYLDWSGSAWIVRDPLTAEQGYFIARGLAGGATADSWPEDYADSLENPDLDGNNTDPNSAEHILLFPQSDFQLIEADTDSDPLIVLVTDGSGLPVKGAVVTFDIASGAGTFVNGDSESVVTDANGRAEAVYRTASKISDNEITSLLALNSEDSFPTAIGLTYVGVSVARIDGAPLSSDNFTVMTKPGPAVKAVLQNAEQALGEGTVRGATGRPWGTALLISSDQFDNPVSNVELQVVTGEIRIPVDAGQLIKKHRIQTPGCEVFRLSPDTFLDIDSDCGAESSTLISNVRGEAFLDIIFGTVTQGNLTGPITFPINVNVPGFNSTELPFTAYRVTAPRPIANVFGLSEHAATEVGGIYREDINIVFKNQTDQTASQTTEKEVFIGTGRLAVDEGKHPIPFIEDSGQIRIFDIPVRDEPKLWNIAVLRKLTGDEDFIIPAAVTAVKIQPVQPQVVEIGVDLKTQFDSFSYTALPLSYEPVNAVMELFEDDVLIFRGIVQPQNGGSLMQGKLTLPPLSLKADSRYQGEFVFNAGSQFSEVRSGRFDLPVSAPVIQGAGGAGGDDETNPKPVANGGGAIILDEINQASCVVQEPRFVLDLVQEAIVTITTIAPNSNLERTFISEETLSAGRHVYDRDDLGFISAFWHEGKTSFTVTAQATSDGKTETRQGNFNLSIHDFANLPVGSPDHENVNLFKGGLFFSRKDIRVPGRGPEIEFSRSYSSINRSAASLGPGWSHSYDSYAQETNCGWVNVSGGVAGGVTFFPQSDGSYRPGRGFHSTLRRSENGWDFYTKDGTLYRYGSVFRFNGAGSIRSPRFYLDFIEDPNGNRTSLVYSPDRIGLPKLLTVQDSSGREINLEYTHINLLPEVVETAANGEGERSAKLNLLYRHSQDVITRVTGLDYEILYNYDFLGRLTSVSNNDLTSTFKIVEHYDYGELEDIPGTGTGENDGSIDTAKAVAIKKLTDPRGVVTQYNYSRDVERQLTILHDSNIDDFIPFIKRDVLVSRIVKHDTRLANPQDIESTISYTGKILQDTPADATVIDPRGVEYLYKMDQFGRGYSIKGPTGIKEIVWSANDTLRLSAKDENGVLTAYEYDQFANVTKEQVTGPNGGTFIINSTYTTKADATIVDLLESREDRRGNTAGYQYDERGNLTTLTYPASEACSAPCLETYTYFDNGDRSSRRDERTKRTSYRYDDFGNVVRTRLPIGIKTAQFDQRSRVTSATDENGNKTQFNYDWLNRLIRQQNAEGGIRHFVYDENSNKTRETDEEGRHHDRQYDFDNRVINDSTLGPNGGLVERTLAYDTNDNLLEQTDYRGNATIHTYDDANRRTDTTLPANDQGLIRTRHNVYDNTSNIISQTIAGGAATEQITLMEYDNLYRDIRTTNPENGIMTYTYDGNDNIVAQSDELGRITETDYDEVNRKVAQRDAVGSDVERAMAWQYDRAGNLLVYIDGRENQQTYQYDDKDRQIFRTNTDDNRFIYQYDDYGNRTDEFDHFGNHIHTDYDELHRPVKVIDQRDFEMSYVYDLLGNPLQETQYNGNVIVRQFDFLNREIVTTDSIGSLMAMTYDDDNNKLSHTDGKGFVTHYQYDALSQQTQQAEPEGRTLLSEYDVFGNVSKTVDGEGNPTALQYDRLNRQIQLTDADSKTILSVYDPVSNKLSETDKRGNTTQWQYDDLDRVILLTEPQAGSHDNKIINRFDANDNLIQSIDKRHIVTDYDYDRLNRVIEERRSGIRVIKNTYSEIGDLIGLEDANGNTTAMEYNQRHEMIVESRPEIAISHYSYDAMGDELNMTDPEGRLMSTTYDLRQRKINHTNGENETTTYTYDLNNKQTQKTRPEQNTWQYRYDELNRLIQITDAQNAISQHTWDRQNNQLSHTDANGNQTQYEYDVLNRRSVMHYPSTIGQALAICTYTYDPNNNLATEVDANGQTLSHQYDALNRLTQTTYQNAATSVNRDLSTVAMQYDGNNNETQVTETYKGDTVPNEVRIDSRNYDDFDRLFNRTDSFNKTLQYRYDLNGNRTGLTDSDGTLTSYTFDGLNRTATVRTNGTTAYQYDRSSLLKTIAYPNNTQASYHYDLAKRILEIHNQQNNATVSKYQYSYDENGNRTEQLEENGAAEQQTTYQYDNNDRLTNVHYDINGATDTQTTYTYDAAYNRTSEVEIQTDLVTQTSTQTKNKTHHYNQRNQLTDIEDHLDSQNNTQYSFDQNGNQTQKVKGTEATDYIYDIRDHLRQVKIGGSTVGQFLYDYDGLRIEKLGERGAERSTYDDQAILQQYDTNNDTRAKFDYGPDRLLSLNTIGEPTQFYLTDAIRSVVNLTNNQGAVQARYQYDAWGQKRNEVGTSYNRFSFTGYEEDRETGLHYAKQRYYDPAEGRFLGEDAWEGDTQIAPSLHKYLYAFQNPTVYVDPTGNCPEGQIGVLGNTTAFCRDMSFGEKHPFISSIFGDGLAVVNRREGFAVNPISGNVLNGKEEFNAKFGLTQSILPTSKAASMAGPTTRFLGKQAKRLKDGVTPFVNRAKTAIDPLLQTAKDKTGKLNELVKQTTKNLGSQAKQKWFGVTGQRSKVVVESSSKVVPDKVIRFDNHFSSKVNHKGISKSFIDEKGNLIPANPNGSTTIQQHIRGSSNKGDSPYTSFTDTTYSGAPKHYGNNSISVNTKSLQREIDLGKVKSVEIITPKQVQAELHSKIVKAQTRLENHSSKLNNQRLNDAKQDLRHAVRDNECLIKGCIPSKFIERGNNE